MSKSSFSLPPTSISSRSTLQVVPTAQPIYKHRSNDNGLTLTYFLSGLNIHWSQRDNDNDGDGSNSFQWKVYIGDIIAISTTDEEMSVQAIKEWMPGHLNKKSEHWKIGLVLALTQTTTINSTATAAASSFSQPTQQRYECVVQWLHKANDRDDFKKHLVLSKNFRSYRKSDPISQIPHMLLNGREIESHVDIARVLPVRITMVEKSAFSKGIEHEDIGQYDLPFFCCKSLNVNGGFLNDNDPDEWVKLNPLYQLPDGSTHSNKPIPRPLRDAWQDWKPVQEITELLQNLLSGFREASMKKYLDEKNRLHRLEQQEENSNRDDDNDDDDDESSLQPKAKRARIVAPDEEDRENSQQKISQKAISMNGGKQPVLKSSLRTTSKGKQIKSIVATKVGQKTKHNKKTHNKKKEAKKGKKDISAQSPNNKSSNREKQVQEEEEEDEEKEETANYFQVKPLSDVVHKSGKSNSYYDQVEMTFDPRVFERNRQEYSSTSTFKISVGDVVAVQMGENNEKDPPFCVKWGPAQILSICRVHKNDEPGNDDKWHVHIRWFQYYHELKKKQQNRLGEDFHQDYGLVESFSEEKKCPIESILPAYIHFSSFSKRAPKVLNDLPLIHVECNHLLQDDGTIKDIDGWEGYHRHVRSIPEQLERGMNTLSKKLANIYKEVISSREVDMESIDTAEEDISSETKQKTKKGKISSEESSTDGSEDGEETAESLLIKPLSDVVYNSGKSNSYYDQVETTFDPKVFARKRQEYASTSTFKISVGDVVAVQIGENNEKEPPFCVKWGPAQILSICRVHKNDEPGNDDKWHVHIRWFQYYHELKKKQQQRLGEDFHQDYGLVESFSEEKKCPIESILPAYIHFSSFSKRAPKVLNGLPLIHVECNHLLQDDGTIEDINGWEGYHRHVRSIPEQLERGMNMLSKKLANIYKEVISSREVDMESIDMAEEDMSSETKQKAKKRKASSEESNTDESEDREEIVESLPVKPLSDVVYKSGKSNSYYDQVETTFDPKVFARQRQEYASTSTFKISVGDIVAVQIGENNEKDPPFCVKWGPAQILSICRVHKNDEPGDDDKWHVHIRWFQYYHELKKKQQNRLGEDFRQDYGLVESFSEEKKCPIESILPAYIHFSSFSKRAPKVLNGLPLIHVECNHLLQDDGTIKDIDGWEGYHRHVRSIPEQLERGMNMLSKKLANIYKEVISSREVDMESIDTAEEDMSSETKEKTKKPTASSDMKFHDFEESSSGGSDVVEDRGRVQTSASNRGKSSSRQIVPLSPIIHSIRGRNPRNYFYNIEVEMEKVDSIPNFKATSKKFFISVGDIVAISNDDSTAPAAAPFQVAWWLGQVIAIIQTQSGWNMMIRKFFRYCDLKTKIQEYVKETGFSKQFGLLESMKTDMYPIDLVLPVYLRLTNNESLCVGKPASKDGLPLLHFVCRHLLDDASGVHSISDWEGYFDVTHSMSAPLQRGFIKLNSLKIQNKYRSFIEHGAVDSTSADNGGDDSALNGSETELKPLEVSPLSSKKVYQCDNKEFYDGVRVDVDPNCIRGVDARTKKWTIRVGYVVPVRYDQAPLEYPDCNKDYCWDPFVTGWNPAQILSIYKDTSSDEWMMEIRWFSRYHELLQQQSNGLDVLNAAHVVFETEDYCHAPVISALPGRIMLSSNDLNDWSVKSSIVTGLPIIPRLCTHICLDEDIDVALDWTNYDVALHSIPTPLTRGLLMSPMNRRFKKDVVMLSRYYKKYIRMRNKDPDREVFEEWTTREGSSLCFEQKQNRFLNASDVAVSATGTLLIATHAQGNEVEQQFYSSLDISLPEKYIVKDFPHRTRVNRFCCSLGDIVCYYNAAAKLRSDLVLAKNMKNPWYPFYIPWSYGQVLSIYSDLDENGDSKIYVEIRRFLRLSEVPSIIQNQLPRPGQEEEILESELVIDRVPAWQILNEATVYLANHNRPIKNITNELSKMTSCRCRYFFLSNHQKVQPLYCSAILPKTWAERLRERGLSLSVQATKFPSLREAVLASQNNSGSRTEMIANFIEQCSRPLSKTLIPSFADKQGISGSSYKGTEILPNWENYAESNLLYNLNDRDKLWNIHVGDLVALKDSNVSSNFTWFPFLTPWTPCRILEIYGQASKEYENTFSLESLRFRVRILKLNFGSHPKCELPLLEVKHPIEIRDAKVTDLIGPLVAYSNDDINPIDWDKIPKHLPFVPLHVGKDLGLDESKLIKESSGIENDLVRNQDKMNQQANLKSTRAAWTSIDPFHIDSSQLRLYYTKFDLEPLSHSDTSKNDQYSARPWTVSMGDPVIVHCEGSKRYPMDCNWQVAEIVAIWKCVQSADELENELHATHDGSKHRCNIFVEIRWLYERHDIAGFHQAGNSDDSNELFETDHVDVIDAATNILAPATVRGSSDPAPDESLHDNMQFPSFFCRRFWCTTRKSLIPCGSQAGRQKRGWLHSKCLTFGMRRKLERSKRDISKTVISLQSSSCDWKKNFQSVVRKMTLKEASKGAYERGEVLVGREKELNQLLTFFRSAIRGDPGSGGVKSSIFLAGPPGVGKTACIRAAIAKLLTEQTKGELPRFDFISLNGMEMRHPFDAYTRLWEELTGRKHVGSSDKACEKLEAYFTGADELQSTSSKSISVVLLDEIDYLITSKQTVLYNFFDWPKRAAELSSPRRLIVVGISNTLNLTEQLLPSVQSRVGNERCTFKAYNLKDVVAILTSKLKEASPTFSVFEDDAILFAAKKTAALSGDIRRAFQICRAAAELVMQEFDSNSENFSDWRKVKISDVQKASRESFNMALVTAVSFLTPFQALLLVALAALCRTTGREVGGFDIKDIVTKMEAIAGASGDYMYLPPPSFCETLRLLNDLGEYDLVDLRTAASTSTSFKATSGGSGGAWPIAALAVDEGTIVKGLKNTPYRALVEKNLPSQF